MAKRRDEGQTQAVYGEIKSLLPGTIAEKMHHAGISSRDQNLWFLTREFEGKSLGVDIVFENGITVMYGSDWAVSEISKRFSDKLLKAFGHAWKLVGTKGNRSDIKNPQHGAATWIAEMHQRECCDYLRKYISSHRAWLIENKDKIINNIAYDVLTCLEGLLKWKESKNTA